MIRIITHLLFAGIHLFAMNASMIVEGILHHGTEYVSQDDEEPALSGGVGGRTGTSLGDRGGDIGPGPGLVMGVAACESMDKIHTHKLTTS